MPEHIRSLIVILILATIVFSFAKHPVCEFLSYRDYTRRRNLWLSLTTLAFLSHSFWIYAFLGGLVIHYYSKRDINAVALFFLILFLIPPAKASIPGFGIVNYLFELDNPRLLALTILLPASIYLIRQKKTLRFGITMPDKLLTCYLLLTAALYLRETSVTDTLRHSLYLITDILLPYFVISRSLKDLHGFRDALSSLVIAAMVLAAIGTFEILKHWKLYDEVINTLNITGDMTSYLQRDNLLRSSASAGHPIAFGYIMAIAIGFYLFLQESITYKLRLRVGLLLLVSGIIVGLSRGPWVGTAVLIVVFLATGPRAIKRLTSLTLAVSVLVSLLHVLPGGGRVINLLPFIGETGVENIIYREKLIENSLVVIKRNPWLGSVNYRETPEMEAMRQGHGVIDIVNTYILITLKSGFVGLILFLGFFLAIIWGIISSMRSISDKNCNEYLLGRSILATLAGILVIILTVSSISFIPIIYWSVAALGVAYIQMIKYDMSPSYNDKSGSEHY